MKKNLNEFWELEFDGIVTVYVQQQILTSAADKASSVLITYLVIPSNYGTNTFTPQKLLKTHHIPDVDGHKIYMKNKFEGTQMNKYTDTHLGVLIHHTTNRKTTLHVCMCVLKGNLWSLCIP
jgi:hypothetical protein